LLLPYLPLLRTYTPSVTSGISTTTGSSSFSQEVNGNMNAVLKKTPNKNSFFFISIRLNTINSLF